MTHITTMKSTISIIITVVLEELELLLEVELGLLLEVGLGLLVEVEVGLLVEVEVELLVEVEVVSLVVLQLMLIFDNVAVKSEVDVVFMLFMHCSGQGEVTRPSFL